MFDNGLGVPQDYAEAMKWYRKAAQQSEPEGAGNAQKRLAELEEVKNCLRLPASTNYYVAACVTQGMTLSYGPLPNGGLRVILDDKDLSEASAKMQRDHDKLQCSPKALNEIQRMAELSAQKIIKSRVISTLMDFTDAINLECKKAAASILKSD